MDARYADGRSAVLHPASWALSAETISFEAAGARHEWRYADLKRADDDNGLIMLKRTPDTGERLILGENARAALKAAAPALFRPQAHGLESPALVGWLAGAALSVAAAFLIGVPLAAEPIARVLPARYQEQVAAIARSQLESVTDYCVNPDQAELALDDLVIRFVDASPSRDDDALRSRVIITLVHAPFPNAFALPDDSIVVTDQLIELAEGPDELAGVLAHELAHISHRHVMANVIRNIGAGVFFDIVFGGAGVGQAVAIASVNLASLRYTRDDEAEADRAALDYLDAAGIDPGALARFFDRMAEAMGEDAGSTYPNLLSSHPATPERAAAARARAHAGRPALDAAQWQAIRSACAEEPGRQQAPPLVDKPPATPIPPKGGKPS